MKIVTYLNTCFLGRPLGLDVESKLLGVKSIIQAWVPGM
mgnify:CR=1 FL=1